MESKGGIWVKASSDNLPQLGKDNYSGTGFIFVLAVENDGLFIPAYFIFHPTAKDMDKLWFHNGRREWVSNDRIKAWMYLPKFTLDESSPPSGGGDESGLYEALKIILPHVSLNYGGEYHREVKKAVNELQHLLSSYENKIK